MADSSDLYAFVSPDAPDTVTIIANYVPLERPSLFEFGDDVLYELHVDVNGDGRPDLSYQFRFRTELRDEGTFLYNTGPIESLDSANWNRRQFYSVTRVDAYGKSAVLARKLACPPCHVGRFSIPDYERLAADAVHRLPSGERVFAGQRADAGFVDPDSIFHCGADGLVEPARRLNVHSIALQIPLTALPAGAVVGVWTSASRRQMLVRDGDDLVVGPYAQVSRRGNPLLGDLLVPPAERERWNSLPPAEDKRFAAFVEKPELAARLPERYPGRFDRLARLNEAGTPRADLVALLLTGIPDGLVDDFANATGDVQADMLRLNLTVPPSPEPNPFGLLGGDLAGFPNGRRIGDDVVSVVVRAVAGATFPLVDESFTPDDAARLAEPRPAGPTSLFPEFPYLGTPYDGSEDPS